MRLFGCGVRSRSSDGDTATPFHPCRPLGDLFQYQLVQHQFRDHSLQFETSQAARLTAFQAAVIPFASGILTLFRHANPPASFSNGSTLRQKHIRFPQTVDDPFNCKTLP